MEEIKVWNFTPDNLQEAIETVVNGEYVAKQEYIEFMKAVLEDAQALNKASESSKGFYDRLIEEKAELKERISALSKALGIDERSHNNYPQVNLPQNSKISKFQADQMLSQLSDMKSYYETLCIRIGDLS